MQSTQNGNTFGLCVEKQKGGVSRAGVVANRAGEEARSWEDKSAWFSLGFYPAPCEEKPLKDVSKAVTC